MLYSMELTRQENLHSASLHLIVTILRMDDLPKGHKTSAQRPTRCDDES